MSQAIESTPIQSTVVERGEFDYHPVSPLAVASLILGLLGLLGMLTTIALVLPLFGLVLGIVAMRQIRRSRGEIAGRTTALIGTLLSAIGFFGGIGTHSYLYATEVPEGYARVNFNKDISKKGFVIRNGVNGFHPDVLKLEDQPIFIKGYMYPTRQTEDLTAFVLVKDSGECCFGGNPETKDMIVVRIKEGLKGVNYMDGLVSVAGTFRTSPPQQLGELAPVYELDATHFTRAKTAY